MNVTINCPNCQARVTVPSDAAGRVARCPGCKAAFRVPDEEQLLDEVAGDWLVKSSLSNDDDDEDDQPTAPSAAPARPPQGKRAAPAPAAKPSQSDAEDPASSAFIEDVRSGKKRYRVQSAVTAGRKVQSDSEQAAQYAPATMSPVRPKPKMDMKGKVNLTDDEIRLHVLDVTAAGVTLGFNSRLIGRPAFRASMPFCCLSCQNENRHELYARPLAWIDKATGQFTNPGEIEACYEIQLRATHSHREIVESMRPIEELTSPFNNPIPYFVCKKCLSHTTVHCQTIASPDGVHCEVTIPSGIYALKWLARVNGICGDEYIDLERRVSQIEDEDWQQLPSIVRQRLSGWFDFELGERFLNYFPDGDFARKDAGLAGVVLTDQRIVWCKYHRNGALNIREPGRILAQPDGLFCDLTGVVNGSKKKMVRLRAKDTEQLAKHLVELQAKIDFEIT